MQLKTSFEDLRPKAYYGTENTDKVGIGLAEFARAQTWLEDQYSNFKLQ